MIEDMVHGVAWALPRAALGGEPGQVIQALDDPVVLPVPALVACPPPLPSVDNGRFVFRGLGGGSGLDADPRDQGPRTSLWAR